MGILSSLFPPSVGAAEAAEALKARQAVALDVRERNEWKIGHIAGSKNIPLRTLRTRTAELDPNRRYVAVCRSGSRSARATAQLRTAGYDVVNLKGGLAGWQRAGLPLDPRNGRVS
jgi:rhodanese-related sulfurtransferase